MKHKLKRLSRHIFRYDKGLDKMVEVINVKPPKRTAAIIIFKEEWYEHIDENPIFIKNKKQLRHECEKRGVIAKALD